jgi:hypothetical protein
MPIDSLRVPLGLFLISLVLFIGASVFRKRTLYTVSGTVNDDGFGEERQISYGVIFVAPPNLKLKPEGRCTYKLTAQTTSYCTLDVHGMLMGDRLRWWASGAVPENSDPRSPWEKFDAWQKIFGITTILSAIGLVADLFGIWQFIFPKGQ